MPLSPLGGSGRTYRLADNLTMDYQDFDEIQTIWEDTVVNDKEVMQIIAASAETVELHAQTPFVMDAVSTTGAAPSDSSLKIGEIDTSADTGSIADDEGADMLYNEDGT